MAMQVRVSQSDAMVVAARSSAAVRMARSFVAWVFR
jgi:hypothetical protein